MSKRLPRGYVVYGCEWLRYGLEEWTKCFDTLEQAVAYINKDFFAKSNMTFKLFKLGREIPLELEETEVSQPAKVTTRFKVKE
jgi:hypothetical protein